MGGPRAGGGMPLTVAAVVAHDGEHVGVPHDVAPLDCVHVAELLVLLDIDAPSQDLCRWQMLALGRHGHPQDLPQVPPSLGQGPPTGLAGASTPSEAMTLLTPRPQGGYMGRGLNKGSSPPASQSALQAQGSAGASRPPAMRPQPCPALGSPHTQVTWAGWLNTGSGPLVSQSAFLPSQTLGQVPPPPQGISRESSWGTPLPCPAWGETHR